MKKRISLVGKREAEKNIPLSVAAGKCLLFVCELNNVFVFIYHILLFIYIYIILGTAKIVFAGARKRERERERVTEYKIDKVEDYCMCVLKQL